MNDEVMQNLLSIGGAIFFLLAGSGLVFYTEEFREYERKRYGASKMKWNWINSRSYIPMYRFFGLIMIGIFIMFMYILFEKIQN
jgi:hypothetical protein